jgi:hypothetical protein
MSIENDIEYAWKPELMVEVILKEPDDFLKVRETLTRIGVASRKEKKLYQSCHILHKNRIVQLMIDWGLITVVRATDIEDIAPLNQIKVLAYKDKGEWTLESKYNIGKKKEA